MSVKPALTAEEWESKLRFVYRAFYPTGVSKAGFDRHAAAALALHNQPFGFTWEDVNALREAARTAYDAVWAWGGSDAGGKRASAPLDDLADRIEALLPPREEKE